MKFTMLIRTFIASSFFLIFTNYIQSQDGELVFEEVIVTAEKRDESLQDVSQAVTAITDTEIEAVAIFVSTEGKNWKNKLSSFVQ